MAVVNSEFDSPQWDRIQRIALRVGGAGLLLSIFWALFSPVEFFRSYLIAYIFWLGIPLGCLVIVMLQHLTGGTWGIVIRRTLESATRTLPLLVLLFLPLLLGLHGLYRWTDPDEIAGDESLRHKQIYLNIPFFLIRAGVYFLAWLGLAFFLNRWSREQDRGDSPHLSRRFQILSGPGLVIYGLTITFASIDWVMSLEPHWYSTIYGAMFGTGQVLAAFAFTIAVVMLLADKPPLCERLTPALLRDLGSLLLAFVMLWAYLSFSQFLLIWAGNLPEEIPWYLRRLEGGWQVIGVLLILFHFGLPFLLLLSRDIKRNRRTLAAVAGGVLVMRFVDVFWLIEPAFSRRYIYWLLDLVALAGVGGLWLAMFIRQLKQMPLLPLHDPYLGDPLAEAGHHE